MSSVPIDVMVYWYKNMSNSESSMPNRSYINHILYNKKEKSNMAFQSNGGNSMTQCDIDYAEKKDQLIREQMDKEYELKAEYEKDLAKLRAIYSQAILDLEKEKEDAEQKEKANEHAAAVRAYYDSYISQGFTEKQAENFIKITLENQRS